MTTSTVNLSALKLGCLVDKSPVAHIASASLVLMFSSNIFLSASSIKNNRYVDGSSGPPLSQPICASLPVSRDKENFPFQVSAKYNEEKLL